MTGPKGHSEVCFPEALLFASANIEVDVKQNSQFSPGPVIKCFVISCNSKIGKKKCVKVIIWTTARTHICLGYSKHDLITCESKVQVVVFLGS